MNSNTEQHCTCISPSPRPARALPSGVAVAKATTGLVTIRNTDHGLTGPCLTMKVLDFAMFMLGVEDHNLSSNRSGLAVVTMAAQPACPVHSCTMLLRGDPDQILPCSQDQLDRFIAGIRGTTFNGIVMPYLTPEPIIPLWADSDHKRVEPYRPADVRLLTSTGRR